MAFAKKSHLCNFAVIKKNPALLGFGNEGLVLSSLNNKIFNSTRSRQRNAVGGEERLEAFCTQLTEINLNPPKTF